MNSLESWLDRIQAVDPNEIEPGLERIRTIYESLVKDKLSSKIVVIGGTNGKGTAAEFLSQILISNSKSVGTFTSPHLFSFNERIAVNGIPVSEELIIESFSLIEEFRGKIKLTYFDFSTLAALLIFNKLNVDFMVLEIGLGGRLDPVNITDSDLAILTNVELDHQEWLGNDRESIGKEKSGIFKFQKPVILGQKNTPLTVIEATKKLQNRVFKIGKDFTYTLNIPDQTWSYFFKGRNEVSYENIPLQNLSVASLSCALTSFFVLEENSNFDLSCALKSTNLRGRCELVNERFLLDVSHNESSVNFLSTFIDRNFGVGTEISAVLGVMADKNVKDMLAPLIGKINKWYTASPNINRSMTSEDISSLVSSIQKAPVKTFNSVEEACLIAHQDTPSSGIIIIFGSFYTVAEAFPSIKHLKQVS
ncbi:MAG: hypothetical protein CMD69_00635 [Gammaproteobacteria bacterium]|nr:hypothetical protein [Gammaproteobacteria bacterium]